MAVPEHDGFVPGNLYIVLFTVDVVSAVVDATLAGGVGKLLLAGEACSVIGI